METQAITSALFAMRARGDIVTNTVLILLICMLLSSLYVLVTKLLAQHNLRLSAKNVEKLLWSAPSIKDGIDRLPKGDDFRNIGEEALRAAHHHDGRLTDRIDLHEWMTISLQRAVDHTNNKLRTGLGLLLAVGSIAPFVGLIGTLWDIVRALMAIGISGQTSIDKVAGPVGESLIITVFGLFVAVSAMISQHWLLGRNKALEHALRGYTFDLHACFLSGTRVPSETVARPALYPARK